MLPTVKTIAKMDTTTLENTACSRTISSISPRTAKTVAIIAQGCHEAKDTMHNII